MKRSEARGPRVQARHLPRCLLSLALLLLAGCSTSQSPRPPKAPRAPNLDLQLMVTLTKAPRLLLEQQTQALAVEYGLWPVAAWDMETLEVRCIVYETPTAKERSLALDRLLEDPRVELAQPVQRFQTETQAARGDPYRHLQHGADSLHLEQVHRLATGRDVKVAVIDTGVDTNHPDLAGRIAVTHNFVRHDQDRFNSDVHGTAVTGVIAALADNGEGIRGVAPEATILALKACWYPTLGASMDGAVCDSYTLAQAVDFAVAQGARVLNLSLAGPQDPLLQSLLKVALARGVVVVAAALGDGKVGFPASMPGVLAVRAWSPPSPTPSHREPPQPDGNALAATESTPPRTLLAPGQEILTTVPGGSYDFLSGSSLATAHVAGLSALLLQDREPSESGSIPQVLRSTARGLDASGGIDACAALAKARQVATACR